MSDPRMIPADEARRLREAATPGPWYAEELGEGWYLLLGSNPDRPFTFPHLAEMEEAGDADLARLAPDLAHTVVEQAAQIERLQAEVRSYAKSYPDDTPYIHTRPGDLDPVGDTDD